MRVCFPSRLWYGYAIPLHISIIWYGTQGFLMHPEWGITHASSNYRHEVQYPFDSLNQNNSAHGVYIIPHKGIAFHLGFGMAMEYPFRFQYICYGTQRIFYIP